MKTIKDLRDALAEAFKLNALCIGAITDQTEKCNLPKDDNNDLLRKDISDARWKVEHLIDELEKQENEVR